jgi:hypothetical protein
MLSVPSECEPACCVRVEYAARRLGIALSSFCVGGVPTPPRRRLEGGIRRSSALGKTPEWVLERRFSAAWVDATRTRPCFPLLQAFPSPSRPILVLHLEKQRFVYRRAHERSTAVEVPERPGRIGSRLGDRSEGRPPARAGTLAVGRRASLRQANQRFQAFDHGLGRFAGLHDKTHERPQDFR